MTKAKKKKNNNEDLDFEIQFLEKILQDKPDFVQILAVLAENYTKKGRYEDGLKIDRKLSYLKPDDPFVFYNLACSYALLDKIDEALEAMECAFRYGYSDWNHLLHDEDLGNLRRDKRFREMLIKAKALRSH
jgi:tetratricopeptide (TPR) repeat protein